MSYEVIARKWRPQQFDDLVGQGHIAQTLKNALEHDRVAHAYLFVGPRGTGKTSTARILAKALNCETGQTLSPCGTCDSCREIMAGNNLDVLEIDGASNNGVEQVRDLRDNVRYAPARGPHKIYIIDEVHMLSIAAFNALLKTLEEPPEHVKFIFATTEAQKVPATILSRCQRFDFRRIPANEIVQRLKEIAKVEDVAIDDLALLAIARGAEGGMRDAQSALDQLIAFRGKQISEEDVLSVFGLVTQKTLDDLAEAVLQGNVERLIRIIAELDAAGKEMQRLVLELLNYFRNMLVYLCAGGDAAGLELTDLQLDALKKLTGQTDTDKVLRIVQYMVEADGRMRHALSKRTLLETALIRAARASTVVGIDTILDQLNKLKAGLGDRVTSDGATQKKTTDVEKPEVESAPAAPSVTNTEAVADTASQEEAVTELTFDWNGVVEHVGRLAPLAKNYLRDAKPTEVSGSVVTLGFDPEFADSRAKIDFPRNVHAIEKSLSDTLGRDVTVKFTVLNSSDTLPGDTKFVPAKDKQGTVARTDDPVQKRAAKKNKEEWAKNPAVQKALEVFNGDIVDIRE